MIDFFYSKLYKYEPSATDNTASSSIEMHARMYRLAEKYGCVDLKGYAQWAFRKSVTWQRHGSMSTWPKQMGSQLLDAAPYIFEQSSSISEGLGKEFVTAFYSAEGTDGWSVMKSVGKAKWVSFAKDYPEAAAEISYYATSVIKGALRSKAKSGT